MFLHRKTRFIGRIAGAALVAALCCGDALAFEPAPRKDRVGVKQHGSSGVRGQGGPRSTHEAPELDPNIAAGAAVLLVGGVLLMTDRKRQVRTAS